MQLSPALQDLIHDQIVQGYIRAQTHPYLPLEILNYTPKAAYTRNWNEATLMCRGLIIDSDRNIVARPFPKFFNWGEWSADKQTEYLNHSATIQEKLDGSLGILYYWDGDWAVATRGSFSSDQAQKATKLLMEMDTADIPTEGVTPLVEIIYPANRIVVDYGDREELILLGALSIPTGQRLVTPWWHGPKVDQLSGPTIDDFTQLEHRPNAEGFVVIFDDGEMVKLKHEEYVRLHRILTGTNSVRIWEALQDPATMGLLMERVPDEFYEWVETTARLLRAEYDRIESDAKLLYDATKYLLDISRKDFAMTVKDFDESDIVFKMADGKDYAPNIWKRIKPEATRPFREEV